MKTQIIFRHVILVAIAIFTCINANNGSKKIMLTPTHLIYNPVKANAAEQTKDNTTATPHKSENVPYLPQIDHEHDIDFCDFKHQQKRILWRCIANRVFAILYHIIILMPIIGESFMQIIMLIKN